MNKLAWYISLAITLFGFFMIRYFFTLTPDEPLKSLNPAFLPMIFVVPFLLLSLFISFIIGSQYFHDFTAKKMFQYIGILALVVIIASYLTYVQIDSDLTAFGGATTDENSTIYGLSLWNSYTNGWFINEMTFFVLHTTAFGLGFFKRKSAHIEQEKTDV